MRRFLLILCIYTLISCGQSSSTNGDPTSSTGLREASTEIYFQEKAQVQHAKHFTVSYHGNYKVVKSDATFYPNGEEDDSKKRSDILVLVQKGTNAPVLEGELKDATIISIPVESVAVNVQHSESYLRELHLVDNIVAIGGLYSYDNTMRNKALQGEIGQIGYSWHSPPNLEVLLERSPELFLMTLASMSHTESLEKSRQLGISTVAVFDWAEEDYLGRAEWIKFYALFFNAEEKANSVFQEIEDRVKELKALAAEAPRKSAMWGYYMGKNRWLFQLTSFPGQYMRDANLDNALLDAVKPDADGMQTLNSEQLLLLAPEIEHWIIGDIHGAPLPGENILASFDAWTTGQLYHNMKRVDPRSNTSDWYATAVVRPDSTLADLIKLVHPDLLPGYQTVFMDVFDKEASMTQ